MPRNLDEQKNAPELPIGRFGKSKSFGGNRVILAVLSLKALSFDNTLLVRRSLLRSSSDAYDFANLSA